MAYIKLDTQQYPLYQQDVRDLCPSMGEEFVVPDGFAEVHEIPQPTYEWGRQKIKEGTPVEEAGIWKMTWVVVEMTEAEIYALFNPPKSAEEQMIEALLK
jgi:hypothetical protein